MDKDQIKSILFANIADIMDMDESEINVQESLRDLGANSVDRMEIIVETMRKIGVKINMLEFANIKNIQEMVDFLYERSEK
ncbi:phosphopantetheine-binding protein [uncultured Ruminococcus sp.]|uniref:phosphopantetheine-binding protein n=1 Tax=uncultured Ruminococcus sp. TaxID=165186 RepID=UPI002606825A|nr:phosphopantetheine-binding protein [uncultured Ruminococcus sp.]